MYRFLLALMIAAQGISISPNAGGTVAGVLKTEDGKPAAGVRIAAVARTDSGEESTGATMASLAETDEEGRYRLENIPPGRYSIAAGRVDLQTYYPGVLDLKDAKILLISTGDRVLNYDFSMKGSSVGRAPGVNYLLGGTLSVPLQVSGISRIPLSTPAGLVTIVLTHSTGLQSSTLLNQTSIGVKPPPSGGGGTSESYRVSIANLPDGYSVTSIRSGTTDLTTGIYEIPSASFTSLNPLIAQLLTGYPSTPAPVTRLNSILVNLAFNPPQRPVPAGVRVSGNCQCSPEMRSFYISSIAGTTYSDGSFEFLNVPPGRHIVTTRNSPVSSRPMGAVVIIGDRDVDTVRLDEFPVLPMDSSLTPSDPGIQTPGSAVPLAGLRGQVLEEDTKEPISEGIVYISGQERFPMRLQHDGRFSVPHLLPGTCKLDIQVFGHADINRMITMGQDEVSLDLTTNRVN